MTVQKKDNRGVLFLNTNKSKATQPDLTGKSTVEGKEWQVAAWENKTADGKVYYVLNYSQPLPPTEGSAAAKNKQTTNSGAQSSEPVKNSTASPIFEDTEDLDAILRSADDDNPFN